MNSMVRLLGRNRSRSFLRVTVHRSGIAPAVWMLLAMGLVGCGGGAAKSTGPARYDVSGKVTYDGKPVPKGVVTFEQLETHALCGCDIVEGVYKSKPGEGAVAGRSNVMIGGRDANGVLLWDGAYKTSVEVPTQKLEKDFDVPVGEVKKHEAKPGEGDTNE